VDELPSS